MKNYPLSRKANVVVQELDNEVLIYDLEINKAYCLNETSVLIWQLCDGNKSVTEISQSLSKKLNSPVNEDLVWLALDQLKQENLIQSEIEKPVSLLGLSRREVIKKVGLATVVALPIVASLVAPTAAQAAACSGPSPNLALNAPCLNSCECGMFAIAGPNNRCCRQTTVVVIPGVPASTVFANRCSGGAIGGCITP